MNKFFRTTILFIILAEIFSFCSFLYPFFNKVCFFVILLITLVISLYDLIGGIYIMLAELFIGSFGYLFFYNAGGTNISLRIGLFLIIMSVWLAKMANKEKRKNVLRIIKSNKFIKYYFLLFLFLMLGAVIGILRKNGLNNIFFDANGYVYFALIFPFITEIKNIEQIKNIFNILLASAAATSIKALVLLFIFSHKMKYVMEFLYKWMRDYRLGELTAMKGGFYRIFSQSHIYNLIALFVVTVILLMNFSSCDGIKKFLKDNKNMAVLYILLMSTVIMGLSRSFWVGGFAAVLLLYFILFFKRVSYKKIIQFTGVLALGAALSVFVIASVVKFPYPREKADFSLDLFSKRAVSVSKEAGASSRWNLLPVLAKANLNNLVFGAGFGSTITYKSNDPKILSSSPTGEYTTYAFEWGYLDIALKIGFMGLFVYLFLVWKICGAFWVYLRSNFVDNKKTKLSPLPIVFGLLLGAVVVLAASIFSPYMNHPLGIGYFMLITAIFTGLEKEDCLSK